MFRNPKSDKVFVTKSNTLTISKKVTNPKIISKILFCYSIQNYLKTLDNMWFHNDLTDLSNTCSVEYE